MTCANSALLASLLSASAWLSFSHASLASEALEQRLQQACTALQASPLSAPDLQVLADSSRTLTNSPALRSRAMAAYAISYLLQGNTNAFDKALQVIRSSYPETLARITVTQDDCLGTCPDCQGRGSQTTLCPTCMGSGKCKACAGTGKKGPDTCSACKGKGECGMCAGKKRFKAPCPACRGTRLVFQLKPTVRSAFAALLSEISAQCEENAAFAAQFDAAAKEADTVKRIALLQALLQAFPHRQDLLPAETMLADAVHARRSAESRRLAEEKRAREERERDELFQLSGTPTKDLNGAIATLLAYQKTHAEAAQDPALNALAEELIVRRNRAELMKKILYGALSLAGALILFGALRPLLFRKKAAHLTPLPGMDKLDKAQFTDPLKLNAKESRSRVKTKTVEIDPPDA